MMYGRDGDPLPSVGRKLPGIGARADGFGMLVEQAQEAFALWRGVQPVRKAFGVA